MASRGDTEMTIENTDKRTKIAKDDAKPAQNKSSARKAVAAVPDMGHKDGLSRATASVSAPHRANYASDSANGVQKPNAAAKKTTDAGDKPAKNDQKTRSNPEGSEVPPQAGAFGASKDAAEGSYQPAIHPHLGKVGLAISAVVAVGAIGAVVVGAVRMHGNHNIVPATSEIADFRGPGDE